LPKDFFAEQIKQKFATKPRITRKELFDFFKSFEPDLKKTTFAWRIYSLKEKHLLNQVSKGIYTLSVKPQFHPHAEQKLKEISAKLSRQFPNARYCVWSTRWLNEFMIHQPGRHLLLVEAEATVAESVFYFLKDENYKNVFINPDSNVLERYVYEQQESIVVKQLVTKAPLKKENKITIPALEKILTDLFLERTLFTPFQGSELIHIYNHVFMQYSMNITTMLAYARRRNKERELYEFIKNNTRLKELLSK